MLLIKQKQKFKKAKTYPDETMVEKQERQTQDIWSRGERRRLPLPHKLSFDVPFFLMSPFNVLFLKNVTQNIDENQQAKSWAN